MLKLIESKLSQQIIITIIGFLQGLSVYLIDKHSQLQTSCKVWLISSILIAGWYFILCWPNRYPVRAIISSIVLAIILGHGFAHLSQIADVTSIKKAIRSANSALDQLQSTSDPLSTLSSANAAELELRIAQAHLTNAWKIDKERDQK